MCRKKNLPRFFCRPFCSRLSMSAQSNYAAWRSFWNKDRVAALKRDLDAVARENGFAPNAFEPFWKIIHQDHPGTFEIPEKYFEMLGIAKTSEGYTQLSLLSAGKNYNAEDFFGRLSPSGLAKLFDADLFNKRLGEFLKNLFLEIALIISIGLVLVTFSVLSGLAIIACRACADCLCALRHAGHTENYRSSAGHSGHHALDCDYGHGD